MFSHAAMLAVPPREFRRAKLQTKSLPKGGFCRGGTEKIPPTLRKFFEEKLPYNTLPKVVPLFIFGAVK